MSSGGPPPDAAEKAALPPDASRIITTSPPGATASSAGDEETKIPLPAVPVAGAAETKTGWLSRILKPGKAKADTDESKPDKVLTKEEEEQAEREKALENFTEAQKQRIMEQVLPGEIKKPSYFALFRFATKFELFLDAVGIIAAIIAGTAQPLMTIVFGALTNQFVTYSRALIEEPTLPDGTARVQAALNELNDAVVLNVVYLVAIGTGMAIFTYIYCSVWIYTGECSTRRIRERYLQAVLRQNVAFYDTMSPGEITTRIATDTHLIQEGISDKLPVTLFHLSSFVTGYVVALVVNWRLALVMSTILPVLMAIGTTMELAIAKKKEAMLTKTAEGGKLVEEVVSSIRNAHAFGTQKKLLALYDVSNAQTQVMGITVARIMAVGISAFFFVIYGAYGLAFFYGTTLFLNGTSSVGQIITAFFSVLIGSFGLVQITPNAAAFASATGASAKIFGTIDRRPIIDSHSEEGVKPSSVEGTIAFDKVDFFYPSRPSVQVLHQFSAVFPPGKNTALVGPSGSGKSSIIALIERFYDTIEGDITVDGISLRDLNVRSLRSHIGLVSQEPTLFKTTVAGNILHGLIGSKYENESADAKRKRVIEAAKQANADGFISALPGGYDCEIGERGMLLSGGQKQRIAIARAIVSDPPILLLDEATSALDTQSEGIVQDALDRASTGRTTITIAHRLSTIKHAHQIIVLAAGRIIESATTDEKTSAHDQLLAVPDGPYSKLVTAQKFREEAKDDATLTSDASEEAAGGGAHLTREEAEAFARKEKPQFQTLRRTGTGRSAASAALSEKRKLDLEAEAGADKKVSSWRLFWRMGGLMKDKWLLYLFGVVSSALLGLVYPAYGIVFSFFLNGFSNPDRDEVRASGNRYALYIFIIGIISYVITLSQQFTFGATSEILSRRVRIKVLAAMMRQDIAWLDRDENSSGALTSNVSDWAQRINGLAGTTLGVIIQNLVTLIVGAIVSLAFVWQLALVGIACIPLMLGAGIVRLKVVVLKDVKVKAAHEESAQIACEAAAAIRTVASLTREEDCYEIYRAALDGPQRTTNRTALISTLFFAVSQGLTFYVMSLIFWYGSRLLLQGKASTSGFFIAMICLVFAALEAGEVFSYVPDVSKARGAATAVCDLFDSQPDIDVDATDGDDLKTCDGLIQLRDVHFRYPTRPHVPVLRGLNLEVKPGQFVAICGPSGCGKSTVIQLCERFYDPLSGTVTVDGQDISRLNVQSYRSHLALVAQEPSLYAGSVKFNITLGSTRPDAEVTQEHVEQACRDANIHDFIVSLPDGYDTDVGGKGTQLSGGQKQRIAIARALIRNPKILLLDEATSALDSESEKVVQAALDKAAKSRTSIVIAHRLSTIQNADVIYVLNEGRVAEKGNHAELLALGGIYAELVKQQQLEKSA